MEYSFDAAQGEGGSADANDLQVRESEEHLIASHAFRRYLPVKPQTVASANFAALKETFR